MFGSQPRVAAPAPAWVRVRDFGFPAGLFSPTMLKLPALLISSALGISVPLASRPVLLLAREPR
jgi:hypothetical protein